MAAVAKSTTTVSTKGQVILPKNLRDQNNWGPGTRLVVEQTREGLLLRREPHLKPTMVEDVIGFLKYEGPTFTVDDMDEALLQAIGEDDDRIMKDYQRRDRD